MYTCTIHEPFIQDRCDYYFLKHQQLQQQQQQQKLVWIVGLHVAHTSAYGATMIDCCVLLPFESERT